jgi:very-short-patch-repair endonuclease
MNSPTGGLSLIAAAIVLAGCVSPMSTREAEGIAHARLDKYCAGHCGAFTLAHTQQIKDRWLVDFEAPRQKFTVIVENDGNAKVTTWDKGRDATGQ